MDNTCVCHGCTAETGRTPTCKFDGSCDKYAKWKAEHERQLEAVKAKKDADNTLRSYKIELSAVLRNGGRK